jgi:hypothetical protein
MMGARERQLIETLGTLRGGTLWLADDVER